MSAHPANRALRSSILPLLAGLSFGGALPGISAGQEGTDPRWLPWLGCWESVEAGAAGLLCVLPMATDVGVEMVSVVDGQVVSREWVRADGVRHESTREGCRGWERARFSDDGRRIYLDAEHLCDGVVAQESTGLLAMLSRDRWIDVRALQVEGEVMTGANTYGLAPADVAEAAGFGDIAADRAMSVRAARVSAAAPLTVDDVIDADRNVHPQVARTWIARRGEAFRLSAERLLRMAEAGVSDEVIDVVVAVTYPDRFALGEDAEVSEIEPDRGEGPRATGPRGVGPRYPPYPPRGGFWDPFYGGYGGYGGYWGGYGYPRLRPTVVVVEPRAEGTGGRVVKGRGYTRRGEGGSGDGGGQSAPPAAGASTGASTGRAAVPRAGSSSRGGSSGAPAATPSRTPSQTPAASGSGTSGGNTSGGSTGRTARPRTPGGS